MALAPEHLAAINVAFQKFQEMCPEFFLDDAGLNKNALCKQLRTLHVPDVDWVSEHVWSAAFISGRDAGIFVERPHALTADEKARIREQNDRQAGRTRYRHDGETTTPKEGSVHDVMNQVEKMLRGEKPTQEKPAAAAVVQFPPLDKNVEDMEPSDRKLFKALSTEDTKLWMKRRAIVVHRERYGLDAKE